jgi:HK97 gp10 family phage protein
MDLEIEGLEQFTQRIEDMLNTRGLERAMGKACAIVERDAIKKAPKGAGDLRRSIQSRVENDGHEVVGIIFSPLEYAPYVEYGTGLFAESGGRTDVPWVYCDDEGNFHSTSGMKPHPYMRPALNENREKILEIIKEGMLNG